MAAADSRDADAGFTERLPAAPEGAEAANACTREPGVDRTDSTRGRFPSAGGKCLGDAKHAMRIGRSILVAWVIAAGGAVSISGAEGLPIATRDGLVLELACRQVPCPEAYIWPT